MWNKPWKYREGFAISIGLLITGALLQVSIGAMEWLVFMWSANIIALTALVIVSGLFYALRSKVYLFRFMTQVEAAVPALATASVLTVIMGLECCNRGRSRNTPTYALSEAVHSFARQSYRTVYLHYLWNIRLCRHATSEDVLRRRQA